LKNVKPVSCIAHGKVERRIGIKLFDYKLVEGCRERDRIAGIAFTCGTCAIEPGSAAQQTIETRIGEKGISRSADIAMSQFAAARSDSVHRLTSRAIVTLPLSTIIF